MCRSPGMRRPTSTKVVSPLPLAVRDRASATATIPTTENGPACCLHSEYNGKLQDQQQILSRLLRCCCSSRGVSSANSRAPSAYGKILESKTYHRTNKTLENFSHTFDMEGWHETFVPSSAAARPLALPEGNSAILFATFQFSVSRRYRDCTQWPIVCETPFRFLGRQLDSSWGLHFLVVPRPQ